MYTYESVRGERHVCTDQHTYMPTYMPTVSHLFFVGVLKNEALDAHVLLLAEAVNTPGDLNFILIRTHTQLQHTILSQTVW